MISKGATWAGTPLMNSPFLESWPVSWVSRIDDLCDFYVSIYELDIFTSLNIRISLDKRIWSGES